MIDLNKKIEKWVKIFKPKEFELKIIDKFKIEVLLYVYYSSYEDTDAYIDYFIKDAYYDNKTIKSEDIKINFLLDLILVSIDRPWVFEELVIDSKEYKDYEKNIIKTNIEIHDYCDKNKEKISVIYKQMKKLLKNEYKDIYGYVG